jgi:hypothetical protein
LAELSDGTVQVLLDAYDAVPSPMTPIFIEYYHGAASRVDPTATVFPHREPGFNILLAGQWTDPADADVNVQWVRHVRRPRAVQSAADVRGLCRGRAG